VAPVQFPTEIRESRVTIGPAPIAAPLPTSYTVEEGDTLFDIAVFLDSTVDARHGQ
jgi:hypothetical protein